MRKGSVQLTFERFEYWLHRYITLINRLMAAQMVVRSPVDKKELLEAFVFRVVASWEVFVNDLLVDCLNRDSSQYADYMQLRLAKNLPRPVCEAMLTGLGYTDFHSVPEIKKVAKNILTPANNPFKAIPAAVGEVIDEFTRMRNYLAHYSTAARRSLLNSFRRNHKLKNFREPADFLYASSRKSKQMRFGDYVQAFIDASEAMRHALGV